MIIEVLPSKYSCGSEYGVSDLKKPLVLIELNSIIEWDFCKFPTVIEKIPNPNKVKDDDPDTIEVEVEKRDFLGDPPELKPGDMFNVKGQIIAVDNDDRIILVHSDTGYKAIDRVYDEYLKTEFEFLFGDSKVTSVDWKVNENGEIPDEYDRDYYPPYCKYNLWKEKFLKGRGFLEKGLVIDVILDSESFIFPIKMKMTDWSIKFMSEQVGDENDEDSLTLMEIASNELLSWFYINYSRIKPSK